MARRVLVLFAMPRSVRPRSGTLAAISVWALAVLVGYGALTHAAGRPGLGAAAPLAFPGDAGVERAPGRPLVVMIAHPRCACTRASLGELDRLMSRTGGRSDAVVVFSPSAAGDAAIDLHAIASRIPGVRVVDDTAGDVARAFGARTSGQVLVFDGAGRLAFAGGITAARGHEGDNDGRAAALRAARGESRADTPLTAVFGCGLFDK